MITLGTVSRKFTIRAGQAHRFWQSCQIGWQKQRCYKVEKGSLVLKIYTVRSKLGKPLDCKHKLYSVEEEGRWRQNQDLRQQRGNHCSHFPMNIRCFLFQGSSQSIVNLAYSVMYISNVSHPFWFQADLSEGVSCLDPLKTWGKQYLCSRPLSTW